MTQITLSGIGKKYNARWIFRGIDFKIEEGEKIGVLGPNGSGKSTFLQLLAGYINPSEGKISWSNKDSIVDNDKVYTQLSYAAPYMDLIDEFSLFENVDFFCKHKPMQHNLSIARLIELSGIKDPGNRQFRYFSSGMKQRIKLLLAFYADTNLLLLDEPLSNLDEAGYDWFRERIMELHPQRTVIICSNRVKEETYCCTRFLQIDQIIQK